jgi:phosphoribosylaminoimidazolecarboxamide formyltransferase / IMP cyclohydrolase
MAKLQRALLSVSDKTGLIPLAESLAAAGIELISTGGTAQALRSHGLAVRDLSEYTGAPEMLDGRVKTLHPRVHGGLLYLRGNPAHEASAKAQGIEPIDLVVVNLYPFEQTIARPDAALREAIENIDIGGPSMLRSAAKNHESVTVVSDPDDYSEVAAQIRAHGTTTLELRRTLATKAFQRTALYDSAIASYLERTFGTKPVHSPTALVSDSQAAPLEPAQTIPPSTLSLKLPLAQTLRYGENPHQRAALYGNFGDHFRQLQGKELSYNNILDLAAAVHLILEFSSGEHTLAILKHTNPCGVGQGATLCEAWEKAFATDKQAPFGGVLAANTTFDGACAEAVAGIFSEVIIAPDFSAEAIAIFEKKKNLRLIKMLRQADRLPAWDLRSVGFDSFLSQERDTRTLSLSDLRTVTKHQPTEAERVAMIFGWRIVKHVKSNAVVYVGSDRTLGIGAGQMSRVDSSRIAVWKAREAGLSLKGSVVCSEAFFPFPDGLIAAAEAGATAVIQPGGSVRDTEVIAAADARGIAMVFTGVRHFRH